MVSRKGKVYSCNGVLVHPEGDVDLELLERALADVTEKNLPNTRPARMNVSRVARGCDPDFPEVKNVWERTTVGGLFNLFKQVTGRDYQRNPNLGTQRTIGDEWMVYAAYLALERRELLETEPVTNFSKPNYRT